MGCQRESAVLARQPVAARLRVFARRSPRSPRPLGARCHLGEADTPKPPPDPPPEPIPDAPCEPDPEVPERPPIDLPPAEPPMPPAAWAAGDRDISFPLEQPSGPTSRRTSRPC